MNGNIVDNHILYDRTLYSVFIMNIPCLRGKELTRAAESFLTGLYPGDTNDKTKVLLKNKPKKGSVILFVLDRKKNEIKKPLALSTLFMKNYFSRKDGNCIYVHKDWVELSCIRNGSIEKNAVRKRNDIDFPELITGFFGAELSELYIFCSETDDTLFKKKEYSFPIKVRYIEKESKRMPLQTWSLFNNLRLSHKLFKVIVTAVIFALALGSVYVGLWFQQSQETELIERRRYEEAQQQRIEEDRENRRRLEELKERYNTLISEKSATVYETIRTITKCLEADTLVSAVTIQDGNFQLELVAHDALSVLNAFENSSMVKNVQLQQVHPENGKERFGLIGAVIPDIFKIDEKLSIAEQLTLFSDFLEDIDTRAMNPGHLRASSLGRNIRTLLTNWRCTIINFQYLVTEQRQEIEFNIYASSSNFFHFLHTAATEGDNIDFSFLQIRNLNPENALNVLFRIKGGTISNESSGITEEEIPLSVTVSDINRNYYTAPPTLHKPVESTTEISEGLVKPDEKPEQASWLVYIGSTQDNLANNFIYVKNTRSGVLLKLKEGDTGEMQYYITESGIVIVTIEGTLYEIRK